MNVILFHYNYYQWRVMHGVGEVRRLSTSYKSGENFSPYCKVGGNRPSYIVVTEGFDETPPKLVSPLQCWCAGSWDEPWWVDALGHRPASVDKTNLFEFTILALTLTFIELVQSSTVDGSYFTFSNYFTNTYKEVSCYFACTI